MDDYLGKIDLSLISFIHSFLVSFSRINSTIVDHLSCVCVYVKVNIFVLVHFLVEISFKKRKKKREREDQVDRNVSFVRSFSDCLFVLSGYLINRTWQLEQKVHDVDHLFVYRKITLAVFSWSMFRTQHTTHIYTQ